MERKYSAIYRQLVVNENDLKGHIAYSLYKTNKIEYIEDFKKRRGVSPSEEELNEFHRGSCTPGAIKTSKSGQTRCYNK